MKIKKEALANSHGSPTAAQLEAINGYAKGNLTEDQVYVFDLRLCDDQVDRDYERFDTQALPVLAKLFIGKTGIMDHRWSTGSQVARIFETQVVQEDGVGFIKAWAYIRRGGSADEVIADIEAGIKKEVSVGCSMGRAICSICGSDHGVCGHEKGSYYDGQLCCAILKEPMDAYEFSFVAVPAQRSAGVLKGMGSGEETLKALAQEHGLQGAYQNLYEQAQLGKQYRKELEDAVVRLCLSIDLGLQEPVLRQIVPKIGTQELQQMRKAFQLQQDRMYPGSCQLMGVQPEGEALESGFLI